MININKKEECCGCYACSNICPKNCIKMNCDNEGFEYPQIDEKKCINCNLCEKVCPVKNNIKSNEEVKINAYACVNNDEEVRINSSSGGIFPLLCKNVIDKGGVVFGAAFDNKFNVRHTFAETIDECNKFRGSKYVQSKIEESYKLAKKFLDNGKIVLFSGTQCQIKGLNLYLRKEYKNLITVDVICHGVPSPRVFKLYIENLIKKYRSDIQDISFRDKRKGWKEFSYVATFKDGQSYSKIFKEDIYIKGFLQNLYLRPSCYECRAKNFTSGSDISLADYWGVENIHNDLDDDKGVSLVLINSCKGEEVFNQLSENIILKKTDLEYSIKRNPCIVKSVSNNPNREKFFRDINTNNIERSINKCINNTIIQRAKLNIIRNIKKVINFS